MLNVIMAPINLLFTIPMIVLALLELITIKSENKLDFKNTIVGLGILGTFFGIFNGLQGFNPNDIMKSIPLLLDGLKTAFWTSIAGMTISMFLTILEKVFTREKKMDDEYDVLIAINNNILKLSSKIDSFKETISQESTNIYNTLDTNITSIKTALNEALGKLSHGATKEIIKALEDVIKDFNSNLTEQFGDNFKQLNEAVHKLVTWQDNYKQSLNEMEKSLFQSNQLLTTNITSFRELINENNEFRKNVNDVVEIIKKLNSQINDTNNQFQSGIQINNEMHEIIVKLKNDMTNLTDKIRISLTTQSETLVALTDDIKKKLPDSLTTLGNALTTLTVQFKSDYEFFLQKIREITSENFRR